MKRDTLQDFGFAPGTAEYNTIQVWYTRKDTIALPAPGNPFYRRWDGKDYLPGTVDIDPDNLTHTHVLLGTIGMQAYAYTPDVIFRHLQGELWSPGGEARDFIEAKGTHHTSMMLGDVLVLPFGEVWVCTWDGWNRVK